MIFLYECKLPKHLTLVTPAYNKKHAYEAFKSMAKASRWPESIVKKENIKRRKAN